MLRGALERLHTDDPPAKMSKVNFRYSKVVHVCLWQIDQTEAGYGAGD